MFPISLTRAESSFPSNPARKATYNLVILDGKVDFCADRQEIKPEMRRAQIAPNEAKTCQVVVPMNGEYIPDYNPAVAPLTTGREAAQALMKLLTCDFDGMAINSRKVSEIFEERMLRESGREDGNWVNVDQVMWFLREVVGMVDVMLMPMFDEAGGILKEHTRLVAVRFTRIGRGLSYQAVRRRYTDPDAPGGSGPKEEPVRRGKERRVREGGRASNPQPRSGEGSGKGSGKFPRQKPKAGPPSWRPTHLKHNRRRLGWQ